MRVVEKYVQQRDGNWYVGDSRVSIYSIIAARRKGRTPEQIQQSFPHLPLVAVYGTITYYLEHQAELDAFFEDVKARAEQRRAEAEAAHPEFYSDMRERFSEYLADHPELAERLQDEADS